MDRYTIPESRDFGRSNALSYGRCSDFVWLIPPEAIVGIARGIYALHKASYVHWSPQDHISLQLLSKCANSDFGFDLYYIIPYPHSNYMIQMEHMVGSQSGFHDYFPNINPEPVDKKVLQHFAKNISQIHAANIHFGLGAANFEALMKIVELNGRTYVPPPPLCTDEELIRVCREFEARIGWKPE